MQNETKKFIIDVIPLTKIATSRQQFYSYLHHEELSKGTLVSIPFFRRSLEGIVLGSRSDFHRLGNFELKKINYVIATNFLTEKQLELAQYISDYYITSLGIILKSFVPKIVKERLSGHRPPVVSSHGENITLTTEQQFAVNAIANTKYKIRNTKYLLHGSASSGKTEVYIHSILELTKGENDLQFLILIPELTLSQQAIERYSQHFNSDEIVVLHSKLSKGEFYTNWQKIHNGSAKIIIGTRMAAFAPFKKLGLIVIDEEQDISYKQWDSTPRYDARTVSEQLCEIHNCCLVAGSATPRVETYYKTTTNQYSLLNLPKLITPDAKYKTPNTTYKVVDMRRERWTDFKGKLKANYSCLSRSLQSEIAYALTHNLQAILFINHQGMNSFTICANPDCKTVLRCPNCDRTLVYDNSGEYSCLHCTHKSGAFPNCNKCHGTNFKNIGIGTQAVQREVHKLFPSAKILRADTAIAKKADNFNAIYESFKNKQSDILIGTQMITKGWDLPEVALVGIIDADALMTIPDFFTDERAFQNIVQAAGRTGRTVSKYPGRVIIQTYEPNNNVIKFASGMDFIPFFEKEIIQRQALHLPPYGKIIKLIFSDANEKKVEKETEKIFNELTGDTIGEFPLSVTEPHCPLASKLRGRSKKQLIIRLYNNNELPNDILKILQKLGTGWTIDVDPISMI